MKYKQPYGVSRSERVLHQRQSDDRHDGSIPPAASIENPQREITNSITDGGFTPDDLDLHQLSKAIQSRKMNYAQSTPASRTTMR